MHILSESNDRGTGCGKAARPGLWGSGEATNRSTRKTIAFTHVNDYFGEFHTVGNLIEKQTHIRILQRR